MKDNNPIRPRYVEASGPWRRDEYEFTAGGYQVPGITASQPAGAETRWLLTLDRRFMLEADDEEVERWLPFLAHAMAIAAGYSCHGEGSRRVNPYAVRSGALGDDPAT